MNFQEAKKKRKSIERYPVKPKSKKQVRDEKIHTSSDKFQEITDEKSGEEIFLITRFIFRKKNDFKIIKNLMMRTPSDPWDPPVYNIYKVPIATKYCPPLHWLEPETQWEKIWTHLDYLKTGEKRDYHYYPEGDEGKPCIFFYDKNSDDLNFNFDWSKDYMDIKGILVNIAIIIKIKIKWIINIINFLSLKIYILYSYKMIEEKQKIKTNLVKLSHSIIVSGLSSIYLYSSSKTIQNLIFFISGSYFTKRYKINIK